LKIGYLEFDLKKKEGVVLMNKTEIECLSQINALTMQLKTLLYKVKSL
jgi:hypothetical protein